MDLMKLELELKIPKIISCEDKVFLYLSSNEFFQCKRCGNYCSVSEFLLGENKCNLVYNITKNRIIHCADFLTACIPYSPTQGWKECTFLEEEEDKYYFIFENNNSFLTWSKRKNYGK